MGTTTAFPNPDLLIDAELDRLGKFLEACKSGRAMNLEELDGFFAALIAGPETVMLRGNRDGADPILKRPIKPNSRFYAQITHQEDQ